jgi:hypothetical protein
MFKIKFNAEICNQYDRDIFCRQCSALEKTLPSIQRKYEPMEDVDGTQFVEYRFDGDNIRVENDSVMGVWLFADVDLKPYFKK